MGLAAAAGAGGDLGFGRCACRQWAIARVNSRELCAECLPAEFAYHRLQVERAAAAAAATLGHKVTLLTPLEGRAAVPLSIRRRRRT